MKHIQQFLSLTLALAITLGGSGAKSAWADPGLPEVSAPSAILIEAETGQILFEKNAHIPTYPASTTKIMTALLALENLEPDQVIAVPDDMGPADGSAMYLLPGESFTVRQLLDALMIKSANDAAVLLARTISGTVEDFALLMNQRARELGALHTNFVNPNGMPDDEHMTTPYDLAMIARHAMTIPDFREIVSQERVMLDETEQTPEKRYFRSSNRFLWSQTQIHYQGAYIPIQYERVDGIKTGWTRQANQCLVSSGSLDGTRYIAVILGAEGYNLYVDSRTLLDYGFDYFETRTILQAGEVLGELEVDDTVEGTLRYGLRDRFQAVFHRNTPPLSGYQTTVQLDELTLPVRSGQVIGTLLIEGDGFEQTLNIHAMGNLESVITLMSAQSSSWNNGGKALQVLLYTVGLALLTILIWFVWNLKKSRKRYRFRGWKKIRIRKR